MIRKYEDRYIFNLDINVRVRRIRKNGIRSREIAILHIILLLIK